MYSLQQSGSNPDIYSARLLRIQRENKCELDKGSVLSGLWDVETCYD